MPQPRPYYGPNALRLHDPGPAMRDVPDLQGQVLLNQQRQQKIQDYPEDRNYILQQRQYQQEQQRLGSEKATFELEKKRLSDAWDFSEKYVDAMRTTDEVMQETNPRTGMKYTREEAEKFQKGIYASWLEDLMDYHQTERLPGMVPVESFNDENVRILRRVYGKDKAETEKKFTKRTVYKGEDEQEVFDREEYERLTKEGWSPVKKGKEGKDKDKPGKWIETDKGWQYIEAGGPPVKGKAKPGAKGKDPTPQAALKRISDIKKAKAKLGETNIVTALLAKQGLIEGTEITEEDKRALTDQWEREIEYLNQFLPEEYRPEYIYKDGKLIPTRAP